MLFGARIPVRKGARRKLGHCPNLIVTGDSSKELQHLYPAFASAGAGAGGSQQQQAQAGTIRHRLQR